jgi:hypothetical protein
MGRNALSQTDGRTDGLSGLIYRIHLVCQSMTRLGKGVLCSRELNTIGRTVATNSE